MPPTQPAPFDSPTFGASMRSGGFIPGADGVPAWRLIAPQPAPIPVLIAVPHAGRHYPAPLLQRLRNPGFAASRLEDRHADKLGEEIARRTGAALLIADAPRAMIDLNRAPDDIDWEMIARSPSNRAGGQSPGHRARSGLGLIPRRLPGLGELWKHRHGEGELHDRIASIHAPYHQALADALLALRARWGAVLLIDLHSMPPLPVRPGHPAIQIVVGDRFGASSHGSLVGAAFSYFAQAGMTAAHNRPYAGGYVLERHALPGAGIHALQIEVDRSCYLDSRLDELGDGFAATADNLTGMIARLAREVAALGTAMIPPDWAEAAE